MAALGYGVGVVHERRLWKVVVDLLAHPSADELREWLTPDPKEP
jgi:hypothetical protein